MYEEYFGLQRPPFKITPDTSLFYDGGRRGDILGALVYAIGRGEGIVKVVGEVGSGKTMLCRMLQQELPASVEIIYIANPSVSADDILFVIGHELALHPSKDEAKHEIMHRLQDYLLQRHMENKQVVLFVEEAQGMPLETLEEIRLLSNLETDQNKLLQIVLFGQPELDQNLSQRSIRQLRERITHSFQLSPLNHEEILTYLNFRMREVGYTGPALITAKIAKKIERYSNGLLRRINIIADKILLSAFAENTHNLSTKHVMAAVEDSSFGADEMMKVSRLWWLVLPLMLAIGYGIYQNTVIWELAANVKNSVQQINFVKNIQSDNRELPVAGTVKLETTAKVAVQEAVPVVDLTESTGKVVAKTVESPVPIGTNEAVVAPITTKDATLAQSVPEPEGKYKEESIEPEEPEQAKNLVEQNVKPAEDSVQWLQTKMQQSKEWLSTAAGRHVSIQVMMRRKSAKQDLATFLMNEWPLDLDKTYIYEVSSDNRKIYRVFYSEFDSVTKGQQEIKLLPESVRANQPYLHSVYRMKKALL